MTTKEQLKQQLTILSTKEQKRKFINDNLPYNKMVDILIDLIEEDKTPQQMTIPTDVYNKLLDLIEDNFKTPNANGRGRKSISQMSNLTFIQKMEKLKSGYLPSKTPQILNLVAQENIERKTNDLLPIQNADAIQMTIEDFKRKYNY